MPPGLGSRSCCSRTLGLDARDRVRLVKGSHIVSRKLYDGDARRTSCRTTTSGIVFVIPYASEFSLIGTTDVPYEGDPAAAAITAEETLYLCRVVNRYFGRRGDAGRRGLGLCRRPAALRRCQRQPLGGTRDYVFDLDAGPGRAPLLSVFGGKLTTYRKLAEHALEKLRPVLGFAPGAWTADAALPGGDMPGADFAAFLEAFRRERSWLPEDVARRLARNYGTRARRILEGRRGINDLGRHFGGGLYEAELLHLWREEWARDIDDVIWRRTKLGLRVGPEIVPPVRLGSPSVPG